MLTAISLFSGCGGLDLGLHQAGFSSRFCVELDQHASGSLRLNQSRFLPRAEILNTDVRAALSDHILPGLKGSRKGIDLLFGGPPCQTFSQIGKKAGLQDPRGMLLFQMVEYARALMPKAILIENVKALQGAADLNGRRGGVLRDLKAELTALGYMVTDMVINSADFGVAQNRKRLFIVATRTDLFRFPTATHMAVPAASFKSYKTIGNALKGLPSPVLKDEPPLIPSHVDVTPAGDRHRISFVTEGSFLAKMAEAPAEVRGRLTAKDTTKFLRLGRDKQSNTLRCGEIFFHPIEDRYLTPREYMRLHGYPDDYLLSGPIRGRSGSVRHLDQHRQVANSVPPPVAKALGLALRKQIFGK